MPEWVYLLAVFAAMTIGYMAGFAAGAWKTDRAPTENAWVNVRRYGIDANKEIAMQGIRNEHEEEMAMIERGVYDGIGAEIEAEEENDD